MKRSPTPLLQRRVCRVGARRRAPARWRASSAAVSSICAAGKAMVVRMEVQSLVTLMSSSSTARKSSCASLRTIVSPGINASPHEQVVARLPSSRLQRAGFSFPHHRSKPRCLVSQSPAIDTKNRRKQESGGWELWSGRHNSRVAFRSLTPHRFRMHQGIHGAPELNQLQGYSVPTKQTKQIRYNL